MPAEYTLETLPEPNDTRVRLKQESGRLMVAVKYSGTWREEGYEENRAMWKITFKNEVKPKRVNRSGHVMTHHSCPGFCVAMKC